MATKSTPDGVDLKLSNYSTTAAMNGSIASANNATLATVAANCGLGGPALPRHSGEDHAAGGGHQVANGAGLRARRLHLLAAGLQGSKIAIALLDAVTTAALDAALLGKADASALGHAAGGRHQDSKCPAGSRHRGLRRSLLAGTPASRRSRQPRPTRRCWPHTPQTPRSRPARPRSRAPSTQSSRSSPPCSFAEVTSFATCIWGLLSLLRWPTATTR